MHRQAPNLKEPMTAAMAGDEIRKAVEKRGARRSQNATPDAPKGPVPKPPTKDGEQVTYREATVTLKTKKSSFRVFMSATAKYGGFDVDRKFASTSKESAFKSAIEKIDSYWANKK